MNARTQTNILILLGAACMFCGTFQSSLGLPDWVGFILPVAGAAFMGSGILVARRAKKRGDSSMRPVTRSDYDKRIRLLLIVAVLTSLSGPFWLPYSGVHLSLPGLIITSVCSCVFSVLLILILGRRTRRKI
jgi:drug/metabolite transporter (DMT)-like permease